MRSAERSGGPVAVIITFFALMFGPTLLAGRMILIGDPLKQFYPIRTVVWQMIRDGHLPLWLPQILSGFPSMSMVMLGIGYPLTWGYLFLSGPWGEQLYVLAPYVLAPLFTYAFLRELRRSQAAAILGGLTFGYGGFFLSPIGLTGVHVNSALWLPLLLVAIARARRTRFSGPLFLATVAYTMSILAGSGQMFLYEGAVAVAYGLFLTLFPSLDKGSDARPPRWQPLAVAIAAIVGAAGIAAFQLLETWTAVIESVRHGYPVTRVEEGSFPIGFALRSLLQPLGNFWDSATFVPFLALLLAAIALFGRRGGRSHVYFWSFIAILSWLLILGSTTPLFAIYTHVPFVRMFRYPSRHSMEWTFAIGVLAAYGWDQMEAIAARFAEPERSRNEVSIAGAIAAAFAVSLIFGWVRYTHRTGLDGVSDLNNAITRLDPGYLGWKLAFTVCIAISIALFWRTKPGATRRTLLTLAAAIACFAEPYVWMIRPIVEPWSIERRAIDAFGTSTSVVRRNMQGLERTYSVSHPYAVDSDPGRNIDAVNWTALAGFEDVNGYESLIPSRYSRAFRGYVDTEPWVAPERTLFGMESPLLDLLNVKYVVGYEGFGAGPSSHFDKDGVSYMSSDIAADVKSDVPFILYTGATDADALAVVTTLGNSGEVENGAPVARITIHTADGKAIERDLLAGVHTAEYAYDRPDVRATVRHQRAPIFESSPREGNFAYHRFIGHIDFGQRYRVTRIDFVKTAPPEVGLQVWKASLVDGASRKSTPLPQPAVARWRTLYGENGTFVLENLRARPRAWLVGKVGTVDADTLLRMVRGESGSDFDPARTAFVETTAGPRTSEAVEDFARTAVDGPLMGSTVSVARPQPGRLVFQTAAPRRAMLVVSEMFYPGWLAKVDGVYTPIHRTDYLLRGVFVPAGRHTVEMFYHPRGLRRGAVISLITLLVLGCVIGWSKLSASKAVSAE